MSDQYGSRGGGGRPASAFTSWAVPRLMGPIFFMPGGGGGSVGGRVPRAPRGSPTTLMAQLVNALAGRTIAGARFDGTTDHMDGQIVVSFTDGSELRLYGEYDEGIGGEWDRN